MCLKSKLLFMRRLHQVLSFQIEEAGAKLCCFLARHTPGGTANKVRRTAEQPDLAIAEASHLKDLKRLDDQENSLNSDALATLCRSTSYMQARKHTLLQIDVF